MPARHLTPIGLGIMGLIALGALPGTADAAKKDKAKAVQKEHKIYWCHATGSWRNPWVIIEIDFHGDGQNPNSRGHDHSHHVNDMPAVLVDGEWVCEEEEVPAAAEPEAAATEPETAEVQEPEDTDAQEPEEEGAEEPEKSA